MTLAQKPKKKTRHDFDIWRGLVLRVIWADVMGVGETTEANFEKEPDALFTSYGEVVGKTDKNLLLAAMIGDEPKNRTLRNVVRIPLGLIKSCVLLEATKEELSL